jgi:uncharacterized protein (DUF2141 family)
MIFPLSTSDITLLFAVTALTLALTSEFLSEYYGKLNVFISKKRVRNAAVVFSVFFMISLALRLMNIFAT